MQGGGGGNWMSVACDGQASHPGGSKTSWKFKLLNPFLMVIFLCNFDRLSVNCVRKLTVLRECLQLKLLGSRTLLNLERPPLRLKKCCLRVRS